MPHSEPAVKVCDARDDFQLSAVEERQKAELPPVKIFTQEENDNADREAAESQFQRLRRGYEVKATELNKPILLKDGLIRADEKVLDYFTRRIKSGAENIYKRSS